MHKLIGCCRFKYSQYGLHLCSFLLSYCSYCCCILYLFCHLSCKLITLKLSFDNQHYYLQVICIDELKTDYKNPIEQCRSLNQLILPEYIIHFTFTMLFIFSTQLFAIVWNLPLVAYHVHR